MLSLTYVKLDTIPLFPHRQAVAIRPKGIEAAKVPEPSRQVGAAKETTNVFFANSDRPVISRILVIIESIHVTRASGRSPADFCIS
jgi:hypothetical protein